MFDVTESEMIRHIHMVSFQKDGQRLECVYSEGKITTATLTATGTGKHRYLTEVERETILEDVREKIGESPVVTY